MKLRTLTLKLSLCLLFASSAWGQAPSPSAGSDGQRPLDLSLPRDVLAKPNGVVRPEGEDVATRNLKPEEQSEQKAERHPYGTGYEARQRGMMSGGNAERGVRGAFGGGGAGRGRMGRGR